ncbi:type III secretion system inner rod subunit SctI [Cupriavidus gilardii]|uniref:type III secretion system inner rod subunit SctI n=1 Tax=Cupriavidus gilardii TaxID=82541 RepID=UPI001ABDEB82|nr:type III secretion system inner rod subunit SctI [Cupriavidus gilardii]MBO4123479.1 type III secretion system inner rod subunit SctI [Cupriavidus gilardii]
MNIDPTTAAGQMPAIAAGKEPAAADIQAFMDAMSARVPKPEAIATEAVRKADATVSARVQTVSASSALDPAAMTRTQQALLEMRNGVDLIAKIAGTLSQSINKLTTMQ